MDFKIIAVDFDGTLCENSFPKIGEANEELIDYLNEQKKQGTKLILWTCRIGERLNEAIAWCRSYELVFDAVNENIPEIIEKFGGDTRKIFANEYIDDRAVTSHNVPFCPVDAIVQNDEAKSTKPKKNFLEKASKILFGNKYVPPIIVDPTFTPLLNFKPRPTYIFQINSKLKSDQVQQLRNEIIRQLDEGLLLLDSNMTFVDRKIEISGHEITVKFAGDNDLYKLGREKEMTKLSKWYDMMKPGDDYPTYTRDSWIIPEEGTEIWCTGWSRGQTIKPHGDGCHVIVGLTVYHCDEFMEKLLIQELGCQRWGIEGVQPIREQLINGRWTRVEFTED